MPESITHAQIEEARRVIVYWFDMLDRSRCPRCGKALAQLRRKSSGFLYGCPCGCRLHSQPWRKGWRWQKHWQEVAHAG